VSSYVSHRNADPRQLARHPGRVAAAERRLRRFAGDRDSPLLLHREASPLSRGGIERRLLDRPALTVYDFDDALQWDEGQGGLYRRLAPKAPKALLAVRRARRVVAGNETLAEWASTHNSDVIVIPSCVDPAAYRRKQGYELHDPPRLVWIGSADNEAYLTEIAPVLEDLNRQTGARLTLVGTPAPRLGSLERVIDRVAWAEQRSYELLADADVGIGPVPDAPYERGKSGYKLLQYGAAALPVVASPVGVNASILRSFGAAAATGAGEWLDALQELLDAGEGARAAIGRRSRAVVEEGFSYDVWAERWKTALELDG
jgi:glycosyltransferase involved in cell wall biosynthesis